MGVKAGNREVHAKSRSRLRVSSVGELTISIGSIFHEMGSFTEKAAFLLSKRKLRWRNSKSCPRRSRLWQVKTTVECVICIRNLAVMLVIIA